MSDDGWQPWNGKRAFTGDKLLSVRFRNGKIAGTHAGPTVLPASSGHGRWDRGPDWLWDVVAVLPVG